MSVKSFDNEDFIDLLDDAKEVGSSEWRHGRCVTYVFKNGEEHYRVTLQVHHEDGIQLHGESTECERVMPQQKTVTVWVPWRES